MIHKSENMEVVDLGIIMNGVTGRMGTNQHLMRSMVEIIRQGGVKLPDNRVIMPSPFWWEGILEKLKKLAEISGIS
jgi:hypothetical protein